ncbi:MAG: GAF domain-containing protein [Cellvibrionaceae bacterium]
MHDELGLKRGAADDFVEERVLQTQLAALRDGLSGCAPFTGALFALMDTDNKHLVCRLADLPPQRRELNQGLQDYRFPLHPEDNLTDVFVRRASVQCTRDNITELPDITQRRLALWGCSTILFVPICNQGANSFGVIMLMRDEGDFEDSEIQVLEKYAFERCTEIYSAYRDYQQEARKLERAAAVKAQEFFLEFTDTLMKLKSRKDILEASTRNFSRRYPFDFAVIVMAHDDKLVTEHVYFDPSSLGARADQIREYLQGSEMLISLDQGSSAMCYIQNSAFYIPNGELLRDYPMVENDRRTYDVLGALRTVLHLPLRNRKQVVGVLTLACTHQVIDLPPAERAIIEHIAEFIGDALWKSE